MTRYIRSDELVHWGIKGQRWGIRRYQNPDGTLTEEGKARYDKQEEGKARQDKRADVKNRRRLSDKSLDEKITRLKKEAELKRLTKENLNPGRAAVEEVLKNSGKKIATMAITGVVCYYGKKWANEKAPGLGDYAFANPNKKK